LSGLAVAPISAGPVSAGHTRRGPATSEPSCNISKAAMERVQIDSEHNVTGLQVGPRDAPAVIVLQEWWGITEEIKGQALRLSEQGYRCLVPDLYKGKLGVDAEEASHLMNNLDWSIAVDEVKAAAKFLVKSGSAKVGVIGFCMGGALAMIATEQSEHVSCGAIFYGTPNPSLCQPERIVKPLQCHFGAEDTLVGFSDPSAAASLEEKLNAGGVHFQLYRYPGVGHGFMNTRSDEPQITASRRAKTGFPPTNSETKDLAWSRVFDFFATHLR